MQACSMLRQRRAHHLQALIEAGRTAGKWKLHRLGSGQAGGNPHTQTGGAPTPFLACRSSPSKAALKVHVMSRPMPSTCGGSGNGC